MVSVLGFEPEPHVAGRQAVLTTAPSLPHHPSPTHKKGPESDLKCRSTNLNENMIVYQLG